MQYVDLQGTWATRAEVAAPAPDDMKHGTGTEIGETLMKHPRISVNFGIRGVGKDGEDTLTSSDVPPCNTELE